MQEEKGINIAPIKGRIRKYLKYKGLSQKFFFERIRVADSSLKGKPAMSEFGGEILTRIALEFPSLSTRWLLTGLGSMEELPPRLKEGSNIMGDNNIVGFHSSTIGISPASCPNHNISVESSETLVQMNTYLVAQCEEKDRQIAELLKTITTLATLKHP